MPTFSEYQRKKTDAQYLGSVHQRSNASVQVAMSATDSYIRGIDKLADAGGEFAKSYFNMVKEQSIRDADTGASQVIREHMTQVMQDDANRGKGAAGLLDRESEWAEKAKEEWVKTTGINNESAKYVWDKHINSYLDRMGSFMVEQTVAYDKQSKAMAVEELANQGAMLPIGDTASMDKAFTQIREMYKNSPADAEKAIEGYITSTVGNWAYKDPQGAVSWFKKNKASMLERWGDKFASAGKMIDAAEAKLQRDAQHAMAIREHGARMAEHRAKVERDRAFSEFVGKLLQGDAAGTEIKAVMDSTSFTAEQKHTTYSILQGMTKASDAAKTAEGKVRMDALETDFRVRIAVGRPDDSYDQLMAEIGVAAEKGQLDADATGKLIKLLDDSVKLDPDVTVWKNDAARLIDAAFEKPSGLLGPNDRELSVVKARVLGELDKLVMTSKKDKRELSAMLNTNEPNSWINKLIDLNIPKHTSPAASLQPPSFNAIPYVQTGFTPTVPVKSNPGRDSALSAPGTTPATQAQQPSGNTAVDRMRAAGITPVRR